MTVRSIQWIADSGLLVGLTTIGEFTSSPVLAALSLSAGTVTLGTPAAGMILGATAGAVITAMGLPAGVTIGPGASWAYNGSGAIGSYAFVLVETLAGAGNSPLATAIALLVEPGAAANPVSAMLDFSQPTNSDLIPATRSF